MKIAFTASHNAQAREALGALTKKYGQHEIAKADTVVALGGDGHVLRTLYETMELGKPVFAMRRTDSVGFLCSEYTADNLPERLAKAQSVTLHPLRLEAHAQDGKKHNALAINEITVIRETPQSARLRLSIDGVERIAHYSGDGMLVATPAGSTAYNHSAGGPIIPLDANSLVVTAICGFRPRGWSYAVMPQNAVIEIEALEIAKRPVRIEAGQVVIHNAQSARVQLDSNKKLALLFDPGEHLGERIIREQFMM